jgi:hypothetical protein
MELLCFRVLNIELLCFWELNIELLCFRVLNIELLCFRAPKYQKWSYLRQRKHKLMQLKVSCWSICSTVHRYVLGTGHLYDLYTIIFGGIMTDNNKSRYWTKRLHILTYYIYYIITKYMVCFHSSVGCIL